jgi:hypothetical protein
MRVVLFGRFRINSLAGHAVLFVGPAAEIDQFTPLGTEGTVRIVLPFNRLPARRTFRHKAKVRRKKPKVKPKYGVRRQSEATTALWIRNEHGLNRIQSGVALRLPTHSESMAGRNSGALFANSLALHGVE